jgi:hypothetical protein
MGRDDYVLSQMDLIINSYTKVLPALSLLEPRYAFLLLKACIHSRPSYLSRLVPTNLSSNSFETFDSRLSKSLYSIINHNGSAYEIHNGLPTNLQQFDALDPLPVTGEISRSLPITIGGLGLRSVVKSSPQRFWHRL